MKWRSTLLVVAMVLWTHSAWAGGTFIGRVAVEWIDEDGVGRDMRLLQEFAYRDPAGKLWTVPAGTVINGASIPRVLWSMVGSPYVGRYRRASVIHDHYCDVKTEPWQSVHRMFYYSMVAGGVDELQAKVMYGAVRAQGPRWDQASTKGLEGGAGVTLVYRPPANDAAVETLSRWVREQNPSLEDLEREADAIGKRP